MQKKFWHWQTINHIINQVCSKGCDFLKKKTLLLISFIIVIVSIFVSCSVHKNTEDTSTTAVTDNDGTTRYYEVVTDDSETTVLYEIVTDSNGKSITKKGGTYVTVKNPSETHTADNRKNTSDSTNAKPTSSSENNADDNDVPFESSTENKTTNVSNTTQKEPESAPSSETATTIEAATDSDGWITKWY